MVLTSVLRVIDLSLMVAGGEVWRLEQIWRTRPRVFGQQPGVYCTKDPLWRRWSTRSQKNKQKTAMHWLPTVKYKCWTYGPQDVMDDAIKKGPWFEWSNFENADIFVRYLRIHPNTFHCSFFFVCKDVIRIRIPLIVPQTVTFLCHSSQRTVILHQTIILVRN